jgi:MFS family permease
MQAETISYARLIRLPNVLALLASICLSRLASRMFSVVIVLHTLTAFGSPVLAGWVAFAAEAPGLLVSPLAGALLDRAGAARGVIADLVFSAALTLVLAIAIAVHHASPPVLFLLVTAYAVTNPLSVAGVRVLLPRLVPAPALDRANALDTSMHAVVDVTGPPLAGALIGLAGAVPAFVAIAVTYAASALTVARLHDRGSAKVAPGSLTREAWEGVVYVVRTPLLRGLAIGYSLSNVTWGILIVAVPVVTARYFAAGTWQTVAGMLWAGMGIAGGIGALASGRLRMYGREVKLMVPCMMATAVAVWPIAASLGVPGLAIGLALVGLLAGPIDVGLLTLRQRRTDPDRLGRVLAVSISANIVGLPIGTALGGMLLAWSPSAAFIAAALASLLAALATWWLIPADDREL